MKLELLTPNIGAVVTDIDLSRELDGETIAEIRAHWIEHQVLFFPDQDLSPDAHVAFARRFGEITEGHPVEPALEGHPNVLPIDSVKDRTDFWHTDVTFMNKPPTGSLLYSVELPKVGGDTMWLSTRAAYDTLAPQLREFCDTLTGVHYDPHYAQVIEKGGGQMWEGKLLEKLWPVEHPVVRVHPENGRRNLFVNPNFTVGIKGFPHVQGQGMLKMLYEHMIQPQFIVRYRWSKGTLAFWDNRSTMHFGVNDYGEARRIMYRVTLKGERPFGV